MTGIRVAAFGLALALQVIAGQASAAPASREAVRAVLRGHEQVKMTEADWRKLGDDVDLRLMEAAADPALVYGARQRALSALGLVRGARAKEYLRQVLTRGTAAPLLASAVHAYAHGFGKEEPAEAQRLAVDLLGHADWQVRRGAVRALGALDGDAPRQALSARESRESHPAVRTAIRTALAARPARLVP